jgi:glycosyltransferase involved in cell wall biosynthesis
MSDPRLHVGLLATHPIQYYAPWYRALAREIDLEVFFSHRQTPAEQGEAGYGVAFDWDVPVLEGYRSHFLENVARRPGVNRFWGCNTPALPAMIRERRFDAFIVHGWATASFWQAMIACWRTRTPLLVRGDSRLATARAWWWRVLKEPLFRAFIPRFDACLVVGRAAREYLVHYGADPARCFDAPHAVDNQFFASTSDRLRPGRPGLRWTFGLSPGAIVFLMAGRLVDGKEPAVFVEAVARAARGCPQVAGLIVGDGPLRSDVEALSARLGAPVQFAGFLNQRGICDAYAASDVLVLPSKSETWGLVVNEAMACGLPAVVSDGVGCAPDLVEPGVTGEIFAVGDVDGLARHISRLAADAPYRATLGENARRHIAAFDVAAAAAGAVRAIRAVARRSGGEAGGNRRTRMVA